MRKTFNIDSDLYIHTRACSNTTHTHTHGCYFLRFESLLTQGAHGLHAHSPLFPVHFLGLPVICPEHFQICLLSQSLLAGNSGAYLVGCASAAHVSSPEAFIKIFQMKTFSAPSRERAGSFPHNTILILITGLQAVCTLYPIKNLNST